jgi:hypothetical protein
MKHSSPAQFRSNWDALVGLWLSGERKPLEKALGGLEAFRAKKVLLGEDETADVAALTRIVEIKLLATNTLRGAGPLLKLLSSVRGFTGLGVTAASCGPLAGLRLLVAHGYVLPLQARGYATPLHAAAGMGRLRLVRFLAEQGADLDTQTFGGATALHSAVKHRREVVALLLLKMGANPTIRDDIGETPAQAARWSPRLRRTLSRAALKWRRAHKRKRA